MTAYTGTVESVSLAVSGGGATYGATLKLNVPNPSPPPPTVEEVHTFNDIDSRLYEALENALSHGLGVTVSADLGAGTLSGVTQNKP